MKLEDSISFSYRGAIHLTNLDLWLDPHRSKPFAFVSHAHADHFAAHQKILCSTGTHQIIRARFGKKNTEFIVLDFGESLEINGFRITLIPAGHIAGSAQILVENLKEGGSLVYTGDFKTRHSLAAEPIEVRQADVLIMETTFGLPRYILPPNEEVLDRIADFVQLTLDDGLTPIVQGYSLGKAQELIAGIAQRLPEVSFQAHNSVRKMNRVLRKLGFDIAECDIFDPESRSPHGSVLVIPPSVNRSKSVRTLKKVRSCVATGWAINGGAKFRYQVDEAFPLSDHAGYDDLIEFVAQVDPQVVYTLHGYASEFATDLRSRGREAWSLIGQNQLELDLGLKSSSNYLSSKSETASIQPSGELAQLAQVCQQIREATGKNRKRAIFAQYIQDLSKETLELVCLFLSGNCFPAASLDGRRRKTQVGWAVIKRAVIKASGASEAEYIEVSASQADSARTTYLLLQGVGCAQPTMIVELAALFESLAELKGVNAKEGLLVDLFKQLHHAESALVVSILLGDLRIGLGEGLIEEAIAEAFDSPADEVRKAQMYTGNLGLTAVLAKEGRLDQWELTPFNALSCMLASPADDAEEIYRRLSGEQGDQPIWLEDKYDGIRAQLHKFEDCAEWFSRDLRPLTDEFPELVEAAMALPDDVVIDGEIIAYAEGRRLSFFDLQTRLGRKRSEGDLFFGEAVPVTFVAFDLLWVNGKVLTEMELSARRELLEKIPMPDSFRIAEVHQATSAAAIDKVFAQARERENEGLVAKDPSSHYLPGRRGKAWLKLKKATASLDVVVVRAQQGHGKRAHVLSDYTFAVRDEISGELRVIGKAYSGLTDEEIEELTEHFQQNTISSRGRVHKVEPNVVLEVTFDSIQPGKRYDSGLSLRFPRIKAIRRDKTINDIDTLAHARKLAGI